MKYFSHQKTVKVKVTRYEIFIKHYCGEDRYMSNYINEDRLTCDAKEYLMNQLMKQGYVRVEDSAFYPIQNIKEILICTRDTITLEVSEEDYVFNVEYKKPVDNPPEW